MGLSTNLREGLDLRVELRLAGTNRDDVQNRQLVLTDVVDREISALVQTALDGQHPLGEHPRRPDQRDWGITVVPTLADEHLDNTWELFVYDSPLGMTESCREQSDFETRVVNTGVLAVADRRPP
ncbi:hypothetical protein [Lentzea sp.]|uniref:hypothetical protein n=1 Tax=Lentzea sp. TaxID=56099 RepID=UPI002ED2E822